MVRITLEKQLDFDDVLILPRRCEKNKNIKSRQDICVERTFTFHQGTRYEISRTYVPVIASNMSTVGTFNMAKVLSKLKMLTCLHKYYTSEEIITFCRENPSCVPYIAVSAGLTEDISEVMNQTDIDTICLDVANGYMEDFVERVENVRKEYPYAIIIAGNVVDGSMTSALILKGADIVKVGIGPGSVCTTRLMTGIGRPQLSAVLDCADEAHSFKAYIISDGGIKEPGDASKALGAGSDFIMLGGYLAGHDECEGKIIETPEGKFLEFYGMSSETAMNKYIGHVANYKASEGKTVLVKYKGSVEASLQRLLGGIRSTCSYIGCTHIKNMSRRAHFIIVNNQYNTVFGK